MIPDGDMDADSPACWNEIAESPHLEDRVLRMHILLDFCSYRLHQLIRTDVVRIDGEQRDDRIWLVRADILGSKTFHRRQCHLGEIFCLAGWGRTKVCQADRP